MRSGKFIRENPDLVRIVADEFLEGSSVTEILSHHPELEDKRYRVYDILDSLGIARRRWHTDYDKVFTDMVNASMKAKMERDKN